MRLFNIFNIIVLFLVAGCASLAKPETFEQKLAYAYGSVTAVRQVAKDLLTRDRITVDQAMFAQQKADEARGYLDLARAFVADHDAAKQALEAARRSGNEEAIKIATAALAVIEARRPEAQDKLQAALTILTALEASLKASE